MKTIIIIATFLVLPNYVYAGVVINELMYNPEGTDSKREWIEVYSDESIDLTTIKFRENNVNHSIKIFREGEVSNYYVVTDNPGGFLLDNLSFDGAIYDSTFSLNNKGETLELVDSQGTVLDSLTYNSDLGANGTGNSLQISNGILIPAKPTPGKENSNIPDSETKEKEVVLTKKVGNISAHSSYIELSEKEIKTIPIGAGRDRIIPINTPIEFISTYNKEDLKGVKFNWVFGNGFQKKGNKVIYTYKHEGTYNLILHARTGGDYAISRSKITVFKPKFEMSVNSRDEEDVLYITNIGRQEVNVGGFVIIGIKKKVVFPQDTIISAGETLILDKELVGELSHIEFQYPNGSKILEIKDVLTELEETIRDISFKIDKLMVEKSIL